MTLHCFQNRRTILSGEYITDISGRSGWLYDAITFITSTGRTFPLETIDGGDSFGPLSTTAEEYLLYMSSQAGTWATQYTFVFGTGNFLHNR